MKSGTFTNNTSFSATAASVAVPSGSTTITVDGYSSASFTVPDGVRVVSAGGRYVGVTPNKTYSLGGWVPYIHHTDEEDEPFLQSSSYVYWYGSAPKDYPDQMPASFTIRWSTEINNSTPDVTDY
nr:MAG TPA: hypothetical protein [Caudoviricetes sp.]